LRNHPSGTHLPNEKDSIRGTPNPTLAGTARCGPARRVVCEARPSCCPTPLCRFGTGAAIMADVDGAVTWTSPSGNDLNAIFLEPVPVTQDNLPVVVDAVVASNDGTAGGAVAALTVGVAELAL